MTRKILAVVVFAASTAWIACGGGDPPPVDPSTVDAGAAATTSAEPTTAATTTAAPSPTPSPEPPPPPKKLFERLGGAAAIEKVVTGLLAGATAKDSKVKKYFDKTVKDKKKVEALHKNLVEQLTAATGGGGEYKGKDMKTAHKGMKISETAWDDFVAILVKVLDDAGVKKEEKDELLGALGGMKGDIVEAAPVKKGK